MNSQWGMGNGLGYKGYEATGWHGVYGPRGVARPIVERLNREANRVVEIADVRERFAQLNLEPVGGTPEAFGQFLKDDLAKYARIAKMAGIQPQ